eukprot:10374692-Alexandrium_andersonii.AAC.1
MSASLVGSEMCIRDSYLEGRPRVTSLDNGAPPPPEGAGGAPVDHEQAEPVSYTHLTLPTICSV